MSNEDTIKYLKNLFKNQPYITTVDLTGCIVTDEVVAFLRQRGNIERVYIDTSYKPSLHKHLSNERAPKSWSHIFASEGEDVIDNNYGVPPFSPQLIKSAK